MSLPRNQGMNLTVHWNTAQGPASTTAPISGLWSLRTFSLQPRIWPCLSRLFCRSSPTTVCKHQPMLIDYEQWMMQFQPSTMRQWARPVGRIMSGWRERALSARRASGTVDTDSTRLVTIKGQAHRGNEHIRNWVWSHYFCQVCASFISRCSQSSHSVCSSPGYHRVVDLRQESSSSVLASVLSLTLKTPSTPDKTAKRNS